MSFPRYPKYKDSGVEWLGEVPEHWEAKRLRHFADVLRGKFTHRPRNDPAFYDGEFPFVQTGDITGSSRYITGFKQTLNERGVAVSKEFPKGTLVMAIAANIGDVAILDFSAYFPDSIVGLVPQIGIELMFLYYLMLGMKQPMLMTATVSTQMNLNVDQICSLVAACPPRDEQLHLVAFLDRETAKIDGLVAQQRRLMELLKEKRQAVISHAVTKGLNPHAPMKPSGIEWLGTIPEHWQTTRLKYATELIVDCPHETPTYSEDGAYLVVRTADLDEGRIDKSGMYRVSENEYLNRIRRAPLLTNDITYGREGERWGHAALVGEGDRYCLGQRMMQFRAANSFWPEYLMWQLNAKSTYTQGDVDTVGATSPHVNVGTIRNYQLTEPPIDEQRKIASFLRQQTQCFDALIAEAQRAIDLLQERRIALISAAVTGQIDVRPAAERQSV